MRHVTAIVIAALALVAAAPTAEAQKTWAFTSHPHELLDGAFLLADASSETGTVTLPAGEWVEWGAPEPLAAGASYTKGVLGFDLYFTSYGNHVNVSYGYYAADGSFHELAWNRSVIAHEQRTITNALGVPTPIDIGHAQNAIDVTGDSIPAGATPVLRLRTTQANALYLGPSALGSSTGSSATVPLPELPALVLAGAGIALVAGVAIVRNRRNWS